METWKQYTSLLTELDGFVKELDESIRPEAFKFLLARAVGPAAVAPVVGSGHPAATHAPPLGNRELAPQEILRKCKVSSLTEKTLVLAYWLEIHQGRTSFTSSDLRIAFERAREPVPGNPSDVVGRLATAGKLMEADGTGKLQSYKLTSTGIAEVEKWLAGGQTSEGK